MKELPLVHLTIGNSHSEFETLYEHLESVSKSESADFQSLIVARNDLPDVFYAVLRSKADRLPNVHMRRIGDSAEQCRRVRHADGEFFATCSPRFSII